MSDSCRYAHDPESCDVPYGCPLGEGVLDEEGRWTCPREATEGEWCIFHSGDATLADLHAAVNSTREVPDDHRRRRLKQFIGATFVGGSLAPRAVFDAGDGHPIDCRHATFESFDAPESTFEHDVYLDHATCAGDVVLHEASFGGELELEFFEVDQKLNLRDATIEGRFRAGDATFGLLHAPKATFVGSVACNDIEVSDRAVFVHATFHDDVRFGNGTFRDVAAFSHSRFEGFADFGGRGNTCGEVTRFEGPAKFPDATFEGRARFTNVVFEERVDFVPDKSGRTIFEGDVTFDESRFEKTADFTDVTFVRRLSFVATTGLSRAIFRRVRASHLSLTLDESAGVVELAGGRIEGGQVRTAETSDLRLSGLTLGDVTFTGAGGEPSLAGVGFLDVVFEGFRMAPYRVALAEDGFRLHPTAVSASPTTLESTYLNAKVAANDSGANDAAAEFFLRQMRYRRAQHRKQAATGSLLERAVGVYDYLANGLFELAAGYGERPGRTLLVSGGVVVLFAGLFALTGAFEPARHPLYSLLFSFQNFITFVLGPPAVAAESTTIQILSALEGFTGAFLVALFVFALTRSVDR